MRGRSRELRRPALAARIAGMEFTDRRRRWAAAFTELVQRIAAPLRELPRRTLPIKMYVAGGAAMHLYTGERVSNERRCGVFQTNRAAK